MTPQNHNPATGDDTEIATTAIPDQPDTTDDDGTPTENPSG